MNMQIVVTDVHPGARFRQQRSTVVLVIDEIVNGTVFFNEINGLGELSHTKSDQFSSFLYTLNIAKYEKMD
jgi:hypothetical protein